VAIRAHAAAIKRRIKACKKILNSRARPKSKMERLCIERQIDDLKHGHERGLVWDEEEAIRVVKIARMLRHWKGEWAGRLFEPEPWQVECFFAPLFGWRRADGTRRFRESYVEIPRKNGKSLMEAVVGIFCLVGEDEQGGEVYSAATTRDQARIVFDTARHMVESSYDLRPYLSPGRHAISYQSLNATFQPVSSEASGLHGKNPHCVIIDEYHEHKTSEVYDVLKTGMGARRQPLICTITTAGWDTTRPCWEKREYARRVVEGRFRDDSFFTFVACADPEDDWRLVKTWKKANPNYGVSVKPEFLKEEAFKAKQQPSYQNTFRRLYLNQWVQQEDRWLDMQHWDACGQSFDIAGFNGEPCWCGLDLSRTVDLTAFVKVFRRDGKLWSWPTFWIPRDRMLERERRDVVPYTQWVKDGWVQATPGNVIDYDFVRAGIVEDSKRFKLREINYDPHNATDIVQNLQDKDGIKMLEHRQGTASMNMPCKELERILLQGNFVHPKNPCLTWNADSVAVHENVRGDIAPIKPKSGSSKRIDGIVALIMAVGRAALETGKPRDWSRVTAENLIVGGENVEKKS